MKRMIMWAIGLLVMVSAANAQLRKGDLLVGGSIGLGLDMVDRGVDIWGNGGTDVNVNFALSPGMQYMLTDNWYIGGSLLLAVAPGGSSTFMIGPGGGYYVPFNKNIGMMNTVGMGFGAANKKFAFLFQYSPELVISLSKKMYLTASLASMGYNSGSKSFSINLLNGGTLGFYYVF